MRKNNSIVLIDDDPISNMITTKIIERSFTFRVVAFTSAITALDELRTNLNARSDNAPTVIFLDLNMPDMDGWEFLQEFEKLGDELLDRCIVIILTSSIDIEDIERSKTHKCVKDFISKPLTHDKLSILSTRYQTNEK